MFPTEAQFRRSGHPRRTATFEPLHVHRLVDGATAVLRGHGGRSQHKGDSGWDRTRSDGRVELAQQCSVSRYPARCLDDLEMAPSILETRGHGARVERPIIIVHVHHWAYKSEKYETRVDYHTSIPVCLWIGLSGAVRTRITRSLARRCGRWRGLKALANARVQARTCALRRLEMRMTSHVCVPMRSMCFAQFARIW